MAKYINFGQILKSKDPDSQGGIGYYIQLDKDVKLTVNGEPFSGKFISVKSMTTKFADMIGSGKFDEEKIEELEQKKSRYVKGGDLDWVKQELTIKID